MENNISVSIIMPVYNVEKYLRKSLESLINQTLKNIEIIVVDDGSTDNCSNICDEYKNRDSRIKVIHKKNQGLGLARNSGLDIAKGEFISFLDSDDDVDSNFYENLFYTAKKYNADAVWGEFKRIDDNGNILEKWQDGVEKNQYLGNEIINEVLPDMINGKKIRIPKSVWSWMYKREIIDKNKVRFCSEREYISEDLIFQLNLLPLCKNIAKSKNEAYYYYRINNKSLSRVYKKERFEKVKKLHYEVCRIIKSMKIYDIIIQGENGLFMRKCKSLYKARKCQFKRSSKEKYRKNL